jgi:Sec-independent protein translocase protein TatA
MGREAAIIVVIALLALGGSQLPKLVRALGEGSVAKRPDDAEPQAESPEQPRRSTGT